MRILTGARVAGSEAGRLRLALADGFSALIDFAGPLLARLLIVRPGGLRQDQTWSLGDGRPRDRLSPAGAIPTRCIPVSTFRCTSRVVEARVAASPRAATTSSE